ncbi:hypothetical protein ARMGADRAFT_1082637 [Armillaria gallica]|uniref:Uncharacterized protein n=1 Tax=Armillaria gallica TaxID=47427 RepID=A0A2H3DMP5_ARMGA|nr:hypothetical protein ARMGADRAFT_1082637 [Armillaria gallica]
MPSERVTLPSFSELERSLNAQRDAESNSSNSPVIIVDRGSCQIIQGPLDRQQFCWLAEARGIVYENCPPGHGYAIKKHPATWPPANSQEACGTRSGKNPEKYCDILQRGTFSREVIVDLSMTRRSSYRVCLHRPIKHHNLRSFNVLKTIPFISADPKDRALGLPGVSVSRLLHKEPNILLNANMSISSLSSVGVSHPSDTLTVEVRVVGCAAVENSFIRVECNHAITTHLGMAYSLARDFQNVIWRSSGRKSYTENHLRLISLYTVDPPGGSWNVAYAILDA